MPIRINNFESNVRVTEKGTSGEITEDEIERIVDIVMQRIQEEQNLQDRISEETSITNTMTKKDLFD